MTATRPETPITSAGVVNLLRERYSPGVHITLEEVRDAAGFSASRSCDVLSLGTWPSRGLTLRGFEVKVSRSDWLREVRDPSKAETFAPYCDEWYIAAGSSKIVQMDELPETWGLLVVKGSRLECVKAATKNANPEPIDRGLLVALLKRATEQGPVQKALATAHANGVEQGKRDAQRELRGTGPVDTSTRDELAALKKRVYDFERATGIPLHTTFAEPTRLASAVNIVLRGQLNPVRSRAAFMMRELETIAQQLRSLSELPDVTFEPASSEPADGAA